MKNYLISSFTVFLCLAFIHGANAEQVKWKCTIVQDGTRHNLSIFEDKNGLVSFEYLSITGSESGTNSCSIRPSRYKGKPTKSGESLIFPLLGSDTAILTDHKGRIALDFSNTEISNYCGQSSAMADQIILKKGSSHCLTVKN